MRFFAVLASLCFVGSPCALAQSEDWLVLPTTSTDEVSWMVPTVAEVSRQLRRQGVGVWSSAAAVARFESRESAPPSALSESAIQRWTARSDEALRALAAGEYATALELLREVEAFSSLALDQLNRDPPQATRVLDSCLYMVRALLETGKQSDADAQALICALRVPGAEPTAYMHPPEVLARYEAAGRAGPRSRAALSVESEPPNCALRVNGISFGKTPTEITDLLPGRYGVQVECTPGVPARVHPVRIRRGRTILFVVDRFDLALRAAPVLHLEYEQPTGPGLQARDAREFARALPAGAVVLASMPTTDTLELRVIAGIRRDQASVRIPSTPDGPDPPVVSDAVTALLAGECADYTGPAPVTVDCRTGMPTVPVRTEQRRTTARPPRGAFVTGLSLGSIGAASLATGYGLWFARRNAGDDWESDAENLAKQDRWLALGSGVIITGAAGSGLLVASMPLVLPYRPKPPWWAWFTGAVGLGGGAAAIALAATADPRPDPSCTVNRTDPGPCVDRGRQTDGALLLGTTAAPLLTIPLVYWLRRAEKRGDARLAPQLSFDGYAGAVGLLGAF